MATGRENFGEFLTIQSIDSLDKMAGKPILPILLYLFQTSNDQEFSTKIINLIFKCFSQRLKIIKWFKKSQILIDDRDHFLFDMLTNKVQQFRFIVEQSEIWLVKPEILSSQTFKYK